MGPIGIPELIIVLVILLVIFGPKRLPGAGRALGTGMREFKDAVTGSGKGKDDDDADERPALGAAPSDTVPRPSEVEPQPAATTAASEADRAPRA